MGSLWSLLNTRAISISVANGQVDFGISWLGILIVIGLLFLWRRLRR